VISAVLAAWLTNSWRDRRGLDGAIDSHDRQVGELNEDLRRWVADRDHEASVRMSEIAQHAVRQGVARGGTLPASAGKVYRIVLHEYRDHASRLQRKRDALADAESRLHARRRRRQRRPLPKLKVDEGGRAILAEWRAKAESDPSAADVEPRLALLERVA
jgi:hypothetical protein